VKQTPSRTASRSLVENQACVQCLHWTTTDLSQAQYTNSTVVRNIADCWQHTSNSTVSTVCLCLMLSVHWVGNVLMLVWSCHRSECQTHCWTRPDSS